MAWRRTNNVHPEELPAASSRLRVAMQLPAPPGPRSGGPGTFVQGLYEAMRDPDLELIIVAPPHARGGPGQRGSQLLVAIQQFIQLCRLRPDVVHTLDHPTLLGAAIMYRALSSKSVRVVFTSHIEPVRPLPSWKRAVIGRLLSRCAVWTVMARESVNKLQLIASPCPDEHLIRVVPCGAAVRLREKSDPAVVAFGAALGHRGGPVLLQVSNFVFPAKVEGTLRLLQAFSDVQRSFPAARLVVIGTGPLVGEVTAVRDRMGLKDSVSIPGTFIEDLSLAVGLSDIHCHISLQDSCPISVLEAMHAGKPIVASRSGGIPELIDHGVTGVLVDNDPRQISAAILDLLVRPDEARKLGLEAQRVARSKFTWDRVAAEFKRLYRTNAQAPVEARANERIVVE